VYEDPAASTTPAASLAGKLDASGLTLILVQPNGLIYEVDSNVTAGPGDMDAQLQTLLHSQGR
jgi:filamentous hemagglutinin family protein